jgi:hypothetical protein
MAYLKPDMNTRLKSVWLKNTIFAIYSKKFRKFPDFAKKRDSNPLPHGDVAAGIVKMFAKKILQKADFAAKKTIFCNNPIGFLQNSPGPLLKIGFHEKLFF